MAGQNDEHFVWVQPLLTTLLILMIFIALDQGQQLPAAGAAAGPDTGGDPQPAAAAGGAIS
jgi:hypothetical protein